MAAGTSGQHIKSVAPGGMSQSRLGINVNEDLGDGWRALANMEHRLMSDTGAASSSSDFWRQAWVGLTTPYGRVTVGRQYNVLFDLTSSTFAPYRTRPTSSSSSLNWAWRSATVKATWSSTPWWREG